MPASGDKAVFLRYFRLGCKAVGGSGVKVQEEFLGVRRRQGQSPFAFILNVRLEIPDFAQKEWGEMSMEKNRIRPVAGTKVMRMSYARQNEVLEMPNLLEVQKDSYQWFLSEGLREAFDDISPIADYSGSLSLEFVDF